MSRGDRADALPSPSGIPDFRTAIGFGFAPVSAANPWPRLLLTAFAQSLPRFDSILTILTTMVIKMVRRMRKIMGAYAGAASQPQIMATNNAFKIVLLNVNFTATAAKNPVATAPVQLCYRLAPSVYRGSIIAGVSSSIGQEAKELGFVVRLNLLPVHLLHLQRMLSYRYLQPIRKTYRK